jgi:hypothetical protein
MTDFFADLERQLVTAAAERRQRLRRARRRRAAAVATVTVAVLAVGAGLAAAVSGGGGTTDGGPATPAASTATTTATPPLSAKTSAILARQTVAVLNGTPVPGLARAVANRLQNAHLRIGNVTNAADQGRAATCVTFAPGHLQAALRVAALLDVSPGLTGPATKADRAVAGEQATVIVTVGSDQNQSPKAP